MSAQTLTRDRIRTLSEADGCHMCSPRFPHPVELGRWLDEGLIRFDLENDCIRLTAAGRGEDS